MYDFLLELKKVSIWGALPLFVNVIFVIIIITVSSMKKDKLSPVDELCDKRKNHKLQKIFLRVDLFSEVYLFVCSIFACIPLVAIFNQKYYTYINGMIDKIEVVGSSVLGLTTIAVTLSVAVILFDRKYYIVFSIRDVLQKYKFAECLFISVSSCIIVIIMQITLINQTIESLFDLVRFMVFEIVTIYNIVANTYVLFIIVYIMFFEQRKELEILGQLYRSFWIDRLDTSTFKEKTNWSKEAVEINVDYLLQKYVDTCRKKKILKIDYIEFATTLDTYKPKWYNKARNKFIKLNIICMLSSILLDIACLNRKCIILLVINLVFTAINIGITFCEKDCIHLVILKFFSDTWGYYIHQRNNKEKFIPRVALRKSNVYDKYIMRMNSLNAFFYIWINYIDYKNSDNKLVIDMYQEVIDCLVSMENINSVIYMPIFIVGFFLYEKNINVLSAREIYNKIVENGNLFEMMFMSQIVHLTRNDKKYIQDANKYLLWLQQIGDIKE